MLPAGPQARYLELNHRVAVILNNIFNSIVPIWLNTLMKPGDGSSWQTDKSIIHHN